MTPRVTIGLPVRNGQQFLKEAIESLLAQDFGDFLLCIYDNASADATEEIARSYVELDGRVRYHRHHVNLGAAENFNRAFLESSSEYFKWASYDDVCAPTFLSRCVELLDDDPTVVLSYPMTRVIDANGRPLNDYDRLLCSSSTRPHRRFHDLVHIEHPCYSIFGVARSEALRRTQLLGKYTGSDRVLIAELGLLGRMVCVPEYLFLRREHPMTSCNAFPLALRGQWFDPALRGKIALPTWRLHFEYIRAVRRARLGLPESLWCYAEVGKCYVLRGNRMARELIKAASLVLMPSLLSSRYGRSEL